LTRPFANVETAAFEPQSFGGIFSMNLTQSSWSCLARPSLTLCTVFPILGLALLLCFSQPGKASETSPLAPKASQASLTSLTKKTPLSELALATKDYCNQHYPGITQSDLRTACASAAPGFELHGRFGAQVRCRLDYGEEPREVMSCLIGSEIANNIKSKSDEFKLKLKQCSDYYPMHTEVDAFLQESCLTGIYLPGILSEKPRQSLCPEFNPERSFQGPCAVGLSFVIENFKKGDIAKEQNQICEQYFDHRKLHSGYRACLNARSLSITWTGKSADVIRYCTTVISDGESETNHAACIVGAGIYQHLVQGEGQTNRFQKCGDNKVSYQDRDYLACLAAASLVDLGNKQSAEIGCKDLYKTKKGRGRGDCLNSLQFF
jgi:hypothetical protein